MTGPAIRILIVDDHPLFREALGQALQTSLAGAQVFQAGSLDAAQAEVDRGEEFDLVLLDLRMPGVQGLNGLMYLRVRYPRLPIAIVSASEESGIAGRVIDVGASGFIPKSAGVSTILEAIDTVLGGEVWLPADAGKVGIDPEVSDIARRVATLTAQQIRVLMMLREGLLNKQIAFDLDISEATVKAHVSAILQKLRVSSRTQAVIAAGKLDGRAAE